MILVKLLELDPEIRVIAVTRAIDDLEARRRVLAAGQSTGRWLDEWDNRVAAVRGDVSLARFGIGIELWKGT